MAEETGGPPRCARPRRGRQRRGRGAPVRGTRRRPTVTQHFLFWARVLMGDMQIPLGHHGSPLKAKGAGSLRWFLSAEAGGSRRAAREVRGAGGARRPAAGLGPKGSGALSPRARLGPGRVFAPRPESCALQAGRRESGSEGSGCWGRSEVSRGLSDTRGSSRAGPNPRAWTPTSLHQGAPAACPPAGANPPLLPRDGSGAQLEKFPEARASQAWQVLALLGHSSSAATPTFLNKKRLPASARLAPRPHPAPH